MPVQNEKDLKVIEPEFKTLSVEPEPVKMTVDEMHAAMDAMGHTLMALSDKNKEDINTMHQFIGGVYIRTVFMPKGTVVVGKYHRKEHVVIISKGLARVAAEEFGGSRMLGAGSIFISPAGGRRMLFIEEDMIWTTIHATNERDIDKLEAELLTLDRFDNEPTDQDAEIKFTKQTGKVGDGTEEQELPASGAV